VFYLTWRFLPRSPWLHDPFKRKVNKRIRRGGEEALPDGVDFLYTTKVRSPTWNALLQLPSLWSRLLLLLLCSAF
jgi:hypothetical protein